MIEVLARIGIVIKEEILEDIKKMKLKKNKFSLTIRDSGVL